MMSSLFPKIGLTVICSILVVTMERTVAAVDLEITIPAQSVDRHNVPVSVPFAISSKATNVSSTVPLASDTGQIILAQITKPGLLSPKEKRTRHLNFVLPKISKGQVVKLTCTITETAAIKKSLSKNVFSWHDTQGKQAELRFGDRPVLRYMYEKLDTSSKKRLMETYKIYHHVFDPTGKRLMTKGPGGLFPHHRGLFYGFNRISYEGNKKADIWHCRSGESQQHVAFASQEAGHVLGRHALDVNWNGKDGKPFATEKREMTAYNVSGGIMIDFASRLTSKVKNLKLDGDPQHAGFQFRASQDVPDKTAKLTYYLRPDGRGKPGSYRNWPGNKQHINLPWNAMSIVLDGKRYTVVYLDRPSNPKPARFSERNYGRFGSYFAYSFKDDKPLELNYRIWVQEGEMTIEQVTALSNNFVHPVKATVKVK